MERCSVFIIASIIFTSQAFARDYQCPTWPSYYQPEFCNCGDQLKNLTIRTPKSTRVMSVCLWDAGAGNGRRLIDLKKEKVSLDEYNEKGGIPYGDVYLSGEMTISGKVIVDEGPSGVFWFEPQWEFSRLKTPFSLQMSGFKFLDESISAAFEIDEELVKKGCSVAPATIHISGFRIAIGETDEAGTYPVGTKVIKVGPYTPCVKNNERSDTSVTK